MKACTLKDIAKEAGVSAMTVSKVMNGKGGVSEETRKRIREVASRMNYTRNTVALSLRDGATMSLGVVLSDSSELVISKVLRGIQDTAAAAGYSIITANTDHSPERERKAIETLISKRIDGLILVAPLCYSAEDIGWLRERNVPFVLLMRRSQDDGVDAVINDNYAGGVMTVEHLLSQGCRSFYFLPIEGSETAKERMRGWKKALADHDISEENTACCETLQYLESGYKTVKEHRDQILKYDALVCGCDTMAVGAMSALLDDGVRIPDDIRIIGYDGIDFCNYAAVPMSTVEQPLYEIGVEGVNAMLHRLHHPEEPAATKVLKCVLNARRSTVRSLTERVQGA